jgi:hypothetical protein
MEHLQNLHPAAQLVAVLLEGLILLAVVIAFAVSVCGMRIDASGVSSDWGGRRSSSKQSDGNEWSATP